MSYCISQAQLSRLQVDVESIGMAKIMADELQEKKGINFNPHSPLAAATRVELGRS